MAAILPARPVHARASHTAARVLAAALALALAACEGSLTDRVLAVDATATVVVRAFLDRNGNGVIDSNDPGVAGVGVALRFEGTQHVAAGSMTEEQGTILFSGIPVGTYRVVVDQATIGDSVQIRTITEERLRLTAGDTARSSILLAFPVLTVAQARVAPIGRPLFIEGVALNARTNFNDNSVHVADSTGAMRTTRLGTANVQRADSVRLLGRRALLDGQPSLDQVTVFGLGPGTFPVARLVDGAVARSAEGGALDAALIRVTNATIAEREPLSGGFRLVVNDGTGGLTVLVASPASFPFQQYLTGAKLDVTGVLTPNLDAPGTWLLRPRVPADIVVLEPPPPPPPPPGSAS